MPQRDTSGKKRFQPPPKVENGLIIFNPKDELYGPLSNNKIKKMYIDGYIYSTVTNYTFANILHYPSFVSIIRNFTDLRDIEETSYKLYQEEQRLALIQALYEGYRARFQNGKIKDILIATGTNDIFYLSNDSILGGEIIDGEYKGGNEVGKALMKLRYELGNKNIKDTQEKTEENLKKKIYEFYQGFLSLSFLSGKNLEDVSDYSGEPIQEIINSAKKEVPEITFLEPDIVWNLYNQGKFPDITLALEQGDNILDSFVDIFRQENYKLINSNILKKRKELILESYVMYILTKYVTKDAEVTEEVREKEEYALDNFKSRFTKEQYEALTERVYKLYKAGELSERLCEEIDKDLDDYPFIERGDLTIIKHKEKEETSLEDREGILDKGVIYLSQDTVDNPEQLLPLTIYYRENITINDYVFPTIEHYIIFSLFKMLKYTITVGNEYRWVNNKIKVEQLLKTINILTKEEGEEKVDTEGLETEIIGDSNFMVPLTWSADEIYKIMTTTGSAQTFYLEYDKQRVIEYEASLEISTKRAMDKKFSNDISLQGLLVETGNKDLYYSRGINYINEILGVKISITKGGVKFSGENIVGKHLMKLREKYKALVLQTGIGNISQMLSTDIFFKEKIENKMREICNIFSFIHLYLTEKVQKVPKEIPVSFILSGIYPSCYSLVNFKTDFGSAPDVFKGMVTGCKYLNQSDVPMLWAYFSGMFGSVFGEYSELDTSSVKKLFMDSTKEMTTKKPVVGEITPSSKINLIISSMVNILLFIEGMYNILEKDNKFVLEIIDIDLAVRILFNKNVDLSRKTGGNKIPKNSLGVNEKILIINELKNLSEETIHEGVKEYFLDILEFINNYKDIPENVKNNRINYFASL